MDSHLNKNKEAPGVVRKKQPEKRYLHALLNKSAEEHIVELDFDGAYEYSDIVGVDYELGIAKSELKIFPNPVPGGLVNLKYNLVETSNVRIDLFDAAGKHIRVMVDEEQLAGSYQPQYDTERLSNGVYMLRLIINDEKTLYKMVVTN